MPFIVKEDVPLDPIGAGFFSLNEIMLLSNDLANLFHPFRGSLCAWKNINGNFTIKSGSKARVGKKILVYSFGVLYESCHNKNEIDVEAGHEKRPTSCKPIRRQAGLSSIPIGWRTEEAVQDRRVDS